MVDDSAFEDWFDRLLDLDDVAREAVLLDLQLTDPTLAHQLRKRFSALARSNGWLEPWGGSDLRAGERFGAWSLVRPIGAGGMGEVWEVVRADGVYEQRAALKVRNREQHLGEPRFPRERQALARLNHAHIVRLLDGGKDATGRDYLVTELIEGVDLADYLMQRRPPLAVRLDLFAQIASAVAHAHACFVVHRDLKPGNVRVDASGQAHLLDFGLAQELMDDDRDGEMTALTPGFAAPEQMSGKVVGTSADIFGLGAILHWMLTGAAPRQADPAAHSSLSIPGPPSLLGPMAGLRRRDLSPPLDAIVGRALNAQPDQRYCTVDALLADVERFRRHQPVQAMPPSLHYRIRCGWRRYRWFWLSSAALLMSLTVGLLGTVWQAQEALRQRDEAEIARDTALRAERGNAVYRDVLLEFARGDSLQEQDALTARIHLAAEGLLAQQADDPERLAQLTIALVDLHLERRDHASAQHLIERALSGRPVTQASSAAVLNLHCQWASSLLGQDQPAAALARADAVLQGVGTEDSPEMIHCLSVRAVAHAQMGHIAASRADILAAGQLCNVSVVCSGPAKSALLNNQSLVENAAGNYVAALDALEASLAALREAGRERSSDAASVLANQAVVLSAMGLVAEASERNRRSIALRLLSSGRSTALARQYVNLASQMSAQGRATEAHSALDEATRLLQSLQSWQGSFRFKVEAERVHAFLAASELSKAASALLAAEQTAAALPTTGVAAELPLLVVEAGMDIHASEQLQARAGSILEGNLLAIPEVWIPRFHLLKAEWLLRRGHSSDARRESLQAHGLYAKGSSSGSYRLAQAELLIALSELDESDTAARPAARQSVERALRGLAPQCVPTHRLWRFAQELILLESPVPPMP